MNQQTQMSEQDITPQEGTNPESEVETTETTTEEETVEETPAEEKREETVSKSQFNQVLARAKKAEDENRTLKGTKAPTAKQPITNSLSAEQVEIMILKTQGKTQSQIDYLSKLAKVNGTTLIEAQSDELFKAHLKKEEDDEKSKKAKLGASRGSGQVRKEKALNTPGISDQEHKELWKAALGR